VGEGYLNLGKGGTFITGVPSRAGKSIVMPLDTTYVLDRGCVLKDCLPPLRIASAPRSIASASYWVYPVRGRIFVGPPHVILRPGFGRSDMRSTHDILNGNTLIAAMIGTDADQQVSHVKDVGHGSAIDLAPGSNYQDYFTTITWGYDLDHSIFKCGQEIVLDREGNILYKRILSKEQLGELFQRYPGFQERFSC
jgi:hypothetical protein